MVNNDKRARHKQGHRSRVEAARAAQAQQRRKKTIAVVAAFLVVCIAVAGAVSVTGKDDDSASTTTTTADTSSSTSGSTVPEGPNASKPGVTVTAPPPGASITGDTPCPPADGSAKRTTAFAKAPPTCIDKAKTYTATMSTSEGDMVIALDAAASPVSVNNFVVLSRYHYFDGLPFHRIVYGFVDQSGSSGVPDMGSGGPGYDLPDEPPSRAYAAGDLAMAEGGGKVSGSQFFLTIGPGPLQGGTYPIVGKVTKGLDVMTKINSFGNAQEQPTKDITIEKVTITES